MSWITRFVVFTIGLSLGTSLWHFFSRTGEVFNVFKQAESLPIVQASLPVFSAEIYQHKQTTVQDDAPKFSFEVNYPETSRASINTKTVVLRESADTDARIVKRLTSDDYSFAEVIGATRDFIHVRLAARVSESGEQEEESGEQTFEGWATWREIVPDMSAIVLDAETGKVVARLPLSESFWAAARYSSDSSRALFQSGTEIYEVRTTDYALSRSLKLTGEGELETVFYGATDNQLYAAVRASNAGDQGLTLVRINEDGSTVNVMEFAEAGAGFAVSPDARTGFVSHPLEAPGYQFSISVIDLQNFSVRNSFTLEGDGYNSLHANNFAISRDGSELYVRLSNTDDTIPVIDTQTGRRVRSLPGNLSAHSWATFGRGGLINDSMLVNYCDAGDDETKGCWRFAWVGSDGVTPVEQDIAHAVAAGSERFAVNSKGTRLFKLDDKNRVQTRFIINRPERHKGAGSGNDLSIFGLSASPDAKHVILFVGMEHGC